MIENYSPILLFISLCSRAFPVSLAHGWQPSFFAKYTLVSVEQWWIKSRPPWIGTWTWFSVIKVNSSCFCMKTTTFLHIFRKIKIKLNLLCRPVDHSWLSLIKCQCETGILIASFNLLFIKFTHVVFRDTMCPWFVCKSIWEMKTIFLCSH